MIGLLKTVSRIIFLRPKSKPKDKRIKLKKKQNFNYFCLVYKLLCLKDWFLHLISDVFFKYTEVITAKFAKDLLCLSNLFILIPLPALIPHKRAANQSWLIELIHSTIKPDL